MSNSSLAGVIPESRRAPRGGLALTFALTILVSAFLLFQVQPLISKFILPWFGGSPAVWTTCLLFFQTLLFCGYAYAHVSTRWLSVRGQAVLHLVLIVTSVFFLPITPARPASIASVDHPTREVLALLLRSVGLPYFVLSSTGPLVQGWFAQAYPGRSPYRLYALSNVGSLVALVSYPFVFEPAFGAPLQARLWGLLFMLFLGLLGAATLVRFRVDADAGAALTPAEEASDGAPPTWGSRALWVALPAFASMMLLATTNHVCQNVAVVPFLWVLPLALYLVSFIVAFDAKRWYVRRVFAELTVLLALTAGCIEPVRDVLFDAFGVRFHYVAQLGLFFGLLFAVCMICHGEVVRRQPSPRHLTEFYLLISAGGALGGVFVSLICPALFRTFVEFGAGIAGAFVLALVVLVAELGPRLKGRVRRAVVNSVGVAGVLAIGHYQREVRVPLEQTRNFYGLAAVYEFFPDDPAKHLVSLTHGIVVHGRQYRAPAKQPLPVSYYAPESGIGRALTFFTSEPGARVGTVGLGVGTTASYSQPGQYFRFYEINPDVKRMAEQYFTYLSGCRAKCEIVMGDARLSLEREAPQGFHLLILDAFSGDAVPTHLLTREAFAVYLRHLREGGVIAVNITNAYLDLAPVLTGIANQYGMKLTRRYSKGDPDKMYFRADWLFLSKNERFMRENPPVLPDNFTPRPPVLWTDDYSNLFQLLK